MTAARPAGSFGLRDVLVLSIGFGAAVSVGVLMLIGSSTVRGPSSSSWEAATEVVDDGTPPFGSAASSTATAAPASAPLGTTPVTPVAGDDVAGGTAAGPTAEPAVVWQRPPGDAWADGVAPLEIVLTSPAPTVDTAPAPRPTSAPPAVHVPASHVPAEPERQGPAPEVVRPPGVVAPTPPVAAAPPSAIEPAPTDLAMPPGLARQGLDAGAASVDAPGWGHVVSEERHGDDHGRDGDHARARDDPAG
jgi:hypothetical protein